MAKPKTQMEKWIIWLWLTFLFILLVVCATAYYLWYQKQQQSTLPPTASPTLATATPTTAPNQKEYSILSPTFEPTVVNEGEPQKLAFKITNQTEKVLEIQGAKVDWYYNPGQGFYLAERQRIEVNDSHWLATKVPARSVKIVYMETSKSSGKGKWRGEITVSTNLGTLNGEVTHTIQ